MLRVWVWLCVCVWACAAPACVRAGVFTARQHAALWKLGWEQEAAAADAHHDSPGADRPWEGWLWDGGQTARPRLRGTSLARPPPRAPHQALGNKAAGSLQQQLLQRHMQQQHLLNLQKGQPAAQPSLRAPADLPQGEYQPPPSPSPSPTALACPQGPQQEPAAAGGPPVFLGPHGLPSLPCSSCVPHGPAPAVKGEGAPGSPPPRGQRKAGGAGPHQHGHYRYLVPRRPQSLTSLPPHRPTDSPLCSH